MPFALIILALALIQQPDITILTQRLVTSKSPATTSDTLLQLTDALPTEPLASLTPAISPIVEATASPNPNIRSLALLTLTAITNRPTGDALSLLEPYLPAIAARLNDPVPAVRQVAAVVLGGFLAHPTPAVIVPLLAYLASPDPPTDVDLSIVYALLTLGIDNHPEIPPAILTFLHRPDLPANLTPRLLTAIANFHDHSPALDTGLLSFLDLTHPAATRLALVSGLPKLHLTQQEVEAVRLRLTRLTSSPREDAALKAQAAGILPCWHSPAMQDPCPAIAVRYRMVPVPKPLPAPHYQSPLTIPPK